MRKLTQDNFIKKSEIIHYDCDYSLVNYVNNKTKVKIICKKCNNIFEQIPKSHLNGSSCPNCKKKYISNSEYIHSIKINDNNYFDYSLVKYKNIRTKIEIICNEHGSIKIKPYDLTHNKIICYKCEYKRKFINKSNIVHGNKYDYSLVKYINSHTKIKIICSIHGEFEQLPYQHSNGCGCPKCKTSKGEKEIEKILKNNNINYIHQKIFNECKHKKYLKFDFYLPDYNICIEYDGEQHYTLKEHWGGEKEFNNIQLRDQIKNEYCIKNNIKLIRIKYDEKIKDKLINILFY